MSGCRINRLAHRQKCAVAEASFRKSICERKKFYPTHGPLLLVYGLHFHYRLQSSLQRNLWKYGRRSTRNPL